MGQWDCLVAKEIGDGSVREVEGVRVDSVENGFGGVVVGGGKVVASVGSRVGSEGVEMVGSMGKGKTTLSDW